MRNMTGDLCAAPCLALSNKNLPLFIHLYFSPYGKVMVMGDPQSFYHGGCYNFSK